jgi:cytochrome oxidase Cu insertion factor (SCO1/SenC/PrrC family)
MTTRIFWYVLGLTMLAGFVASTLLLWPKSSAAGPRALKAGDKAPDFTLPDQNRRTVKLSDYLGKKNVVLAFYIRAATPG